MDAAETRKKLHYRELMKKAVYVSSHEGARGLGVDNLVKKMVLEAKKGIPVKSEWQNREFVIDAELPLELALKEWREQACKPLLQQKIDDGSLTPEKLIKTLQATAEDTCVDKKDSDSHINAAWTEALVTNFPEYADKPTILQIMNAYYKASDKNAVTLETILDTKIQKYISVEETFPHTLDNIVALQRLSESYSAQKLENPQELEDKIAESELKMLKELNPEDLKYTSDALLAAGRNIAEKHQE